jgi:uridine kinase
LERIAGADDILVFDGVFLLRPELDDHWDYRVFVHADFQETVRRAMTRDQALFGSPDQVRTRYEGKYVPGQELYFAEARPRERADIVIDNNDPNAPTLTPLH